MQRSNMDTPQMVSEEPTTVLGESSALINVTSTSSRVQRIRQHTMTLVRPEKKIGPAPTVLQSLRAILVASCQLVHASIVQRSHMSNACRVESSFALYSCISVFFLENFQKICPLICATIVGLAFCFACILKKRNDHLRL